MATPVSEGDEAPDFTLETDSGGQVGLSQFSGRIVVVYFYPKDATPGCTTEGLAFTELHMDFATAGIPVVGISPDSTASHDRFKAKYNLAVTLAADPDHAVADSYGVWKEKNMYGRKFMGIERSTFLIGADGRIARVWRKVRVKGHAREVLESARSLAGRS